jgi:hypothetical protein
MPGRQPIVPALEGEREGTPNKAGPAPIAFAGHPELPRLPKPRGRVRQRRRVSFEDFDRFVEENDIHPDDVPAAFADWLAQQTGEIVVAGPADEPPLIIAIRDDAEIEP